MKNMLYHEFNGTILFLGFGAVAQCTLPLLLKHITCDTKKIIIIDTIRPAIMDRYEALGIRFVNVTITPENLYDTLQKYVSAGDLIIDLAYDIDCCTLVQWCHDAGVLYVNTSVELWDPYKDMVQRTPPERALYPRHMALRALKNTWATPGVTMVIEHGANPGLVSHFTKKALVDITQELLEKSELKSPLILSAPKGRIEGEGLKKQLLRALETQNFPLLAQLLGIKTIHISERDTQVASVPRAVNEFVNTWSIEGFHEEGVAPAEMGWGTHEKELPAHAYTHATGPQNQICLAQMGIQTWARSCVPSGPIIGMIVRHGESFTISDHLTIWGTHETSKSPFVPSAPQGCIEGSERIATYRPTVHYVYCPTDATLSSLHEFKARNLVLQEKKRIMRDEIVAGTDEVGVLLMGHAFKSWWTGSVLSIDQARALAPGQNATTLQVACSVLGAVVWMMRNPQQGLCVPDDLPYQEILEIASPYLGDFVSQPIDWTPLDRRIDYFKGFGAAECCDYTDPWQFKNFRITSL